MLFIMQSINPCSKFGPIRGRAARTMGVLAIAIVVAVGTLAVPSGVWAQSSVGRGDVQALINRIDRLQREMTTLQRQVYRDGVPSGAATGAGAPIAGPAAVGAPGEPNLAAAMQVRLDEIESQMRGFTGMLEELQHAIDGVRKHLDKLASDVDFRWKALESRPVTPAPAAGAPLANAAPVAAPRLNAAPSQPGVLGTIPLRDLGGQGSVKPGAAPIPQLRKGPAKKLAKMAPALPKGTPKVRYKYATDLLFRSDFGAAEQAFTAFVVAHPKHRLAGNAQYWLGETHYARGAFRAAAAIFAEGYQKYPKSAKAPDNLLKLGMSLAAIGKKKSACITFNRLVKEFPKASRSVRSRARSQRKKLRCR